MTIVPLPGTIPFESSFQYWLPAVHSFLLVRTVHYWNPEVITTESIAWRSRSSEVSTLDWLNSTLRTDTVALVDRGSHSRTQFIESATHYLTSPDQGFVISGVMFEPSLIDSFNYAWVEFVRSSLPGSFTDELALLGISFF